MAKVNLAELNNARSHLQAEGRRIRDELRALRRSLNRVIRSPSMSGAVKDAIELGIENQHLPIIDGLNECYILLNQTFIKSFNEWQDYMNEESNQAIIEDAGLRRNVQILDNNNGDKQDMDASIAAIYNNIREYLDFSMPNNVAYEDSFGEARSHLNELLASSESFSFEYTELNQLTGQIRVAINQLRTAVGKDFKDPARIEMASNTAFREVMSFITVNRQQQELEALQALIELWEGMNPNQSFLDLPRPIDQATLVAWMKQHHGIGWTVNDLFIGIGTGENGVSGNLDFELLNNFFGSFEEAVLPDLLEGFGIPNASRLGLPLGVVSFIWELDQDIRNGTPVGQAVVSNTTSTTVTAGVGLVLSALKIKPILAAAGGWATGEVVGNIPGAQGVFEWLGRPITNWNNNRQENSTQFWHDENAYWSRRISPTGWDWIETNHPDWWMRNLSLPELYELWQQYLRPQ